MLNESGFLFLGDSAYQKMTFEQQRLANERAGEFDRLVAEKLAEIGGEWSPEKMAIAINYAVAAQNPDQGELVYELEHEP